MIDSIVTKEGKKPILILFIIFLVLIVIDCEILAFLSFVALLSLIYIFRFKYVDINSLMDNGIYAPISGTISSIDSDGFKKTITIDVGLKDLHILRSPDTSKVKVIQKRGINLPLGTYKANKLNEKAIIQYDNMGMELISSLCNPSIQIEKKPTFKKGEKIGIFIHGKVIIALNKEMKTDLKIGQKLISGQTLIAQY